MGRARRRIIAVGDLHLPWCHAPAVKFALKRIKEFAPEAIVQVGDLYDLYSYNRYGRSQSVMSPQQEQIHGRAAAEEFWKNAREAAPKAKLYQLAGNHDARIIKRIMEKAPEYEFVVLEKFEELLTFKNVTTIFDPREELIIDDVTFIHGYLTGIGAHMMESHENVVCGHTHRGGAVFHPWGGKMKWELNVGFLGDRKAVPLSYTMRKKFSRWTLGVGEIDESGPKFCPFEE